jgi:ClpP class serine protease
MQAQHFNILGLAPAYGHLLAQSGPSQYLADRIAEPAVKGESYDYLKYITDRMRVQGRQDVVVLNFTGLVNRYDNYGNSYGTETLATMLDYMAEQGDVLGVVVRAIGPGGDLNGMKGLSDAIYRFRKPIVGWTPFAASATYIPLAQCDEIWLDDSKVTQVGSIGAFVVNADLSEAHAARGERYEVIRPKDAPHKNKPNQYEPLDDESRADLQKVVAVANQEIKALVRRGRGSKIKDQSVFEGKMYLQEDAISLGLADSKGSLSQAIQRVVQLSLSK